MKKIERIGLKCIVAVGSNGVIGNSTTNDLVWRNKLDMSEFKRLTEPGVVVMGKNTWKSIPEKYKPLTGRINIVFSRDPDFKAKGARVVNTTFKDWFKQDEVQTRRDNFWVIGGGWLYKESFDYCDDFYITEIQEELDGDVTFPLDRVKDSSVCKEVYRVKNDGFDFVRYVRIL